MVVILLPNSGGVLHEPRSTSRAGSFCSLPRGIRYGLRSGSQEELQRKEGFEIRTRVPLRDARKVPVGTTSSTISRRRKTDSRAQRCGQLWVHPWV